MPMKMPNFPGMQPKKGIAPFCTAVRNVFEEKKKVSERMWTSIQANLQKG